METTSGNGATHKTIAVLMAGDMGHAVGRALREHGHDVVTALDGRSAHTRTLAETAGLEDAGTVAEAVRRADLVLSILPPSQATALASEVAAAMTSSGNKPVYVDCNAISPDTVTQVSAEIGKAGAPFIDAGIIGLGPRPGSAGPRFYVSGADVSPMLSLDGKGFSVIAIGEEIGKASALKMAYAGLTKGTWTLHTAVLLAGQRLGVAEELIREFGLSQAATLEAMRARVPFLPADSGRWIGEMEEIAATFSEAQVTSGFHDGAADIFRLLAKTPYASETRQTLDHSRTLEDALDTYAAQIAKDNT